MSDMVTENVMTTRETYKVSLICNTISALTFAFLTTANIIEKGFASIGNVPLGIFTLVFGGIALFSAVKYRTSNF